MSSVLALARPDILALKAYEHASWDSGFERLHANELPWRGIGDSSDAGLNRYPEPHPHALEAQLAALYEVPPRNVLAGRGSDEAIDLLTRAFCNAGTDNVVVCPPTFGMYAVAARIQGAQVISVPLQAERGFAPDVDAIVAACTANTKLVYLCSPNNPTGNSIDANSIRQLVRKLEGRALVVLDEAYLEFSKDKSFTSYLSDFDNLCILRTFSKAYGLAGARLGTLIAHADIIALLRKVIPPYAITQMTIEAVSRALQPAELAVTRERIAAILVERERVARALAQLPGVERVWPSDANFILVDFVDAGAALERTRGASLLVRDVRGYPGLGRSLRITIGSPEQNDRLIGSLA